MDGTGGRGPTGQGLALAAGAEAKVTQTILRQVTGLMA